MKKTTTTSASLLLAFAALAIPRILHADELRSGKSLTTNIRVLGINDGALRFLSAGREQTLPFKAIDALDIAALPSFKAAESLRQSDPKSAAVLYRQAIRQTNDDTLRLLVIARFIAPADAAGQWTDAVDAFLRIYRLSPTDGTWALRPAHLPAAGSVLLEQSAGQIDALLNDESVTLSLDSRRRLRTWQVEIYTQAHDARAGQLAQELARGVKENKASAPDPKTTPAADPLADVKAQTAAQNWKSALTLIDQRLPNATGDTAIQLLTLQAQSHESLHEPESAATSWLSIATFYPESPQAPAALLHAGKIQDSLKRSEEAQHLYAALRERYPNSVEAVQIK